MKSEYDAKELILIIVLIIFIFIFGGCLILWASKLFLATGVIFYGMPIWTKIIHYIFCLNVFVVGGVAFGVAIDMFNELIVKG